MFTAVQFRQDARYVTRSRPAHEGDSSRRYNHVLNGQQFHEPSNQNCTQYASHTTVTSQL